MQATAQVCRLCAGQWLMVRPLSQSSKRYRYKTKWVEMTHKKVKPQELALAYFDTYYGNLYGEKCWIQAREALLHRKKKFCALVNNFGDVEKTIVDLITEQKAYDMFSMTGDKLKIPSSSQSNDISEQGHTGNTDMPGQVYRVGEKEKEQIKYRETAEGFIVPCTDFLGLSKPLHPPDLFDFMPATRRVTEKEVLSQQLQEQASLCTQSSSIEVQSDDEFVVPPMLKVHIHEIGSNELFRTPRQDKSKMLEYYLMDGASVLPVLALGLKPDDDILDLCAAPGGKALATVQTLIYNKIVCVDPSASRLARLHDTMTWYVPGCFSESSSPNRISLLKADGRIIGDEYQGHFDKVLVDVPCNTDRQVLHDDENNLFKRTRVTERLQLPKLQAELLKSGIKACRPGGTVVYSTCTMTPGQNGYVVEAAITELHQTTNIRVAVQQTTALKQRLSHIFNFWQRDRYGQLVIPSVQSNFGPCYFVKLMRLE